MSETSSRLWCPHMLLSLILFYCLCCSSTTTYVQASVRALAFPWNDLYELACILRSPVRDTFSLCCLPWAPAPAQSLLVGAFSWTSLGAPWGQDQPLVSSGPTSPTRAGGGHTAGPLRRVVGRRDTAESRLPVTGSAFQPQPEAHSLREARLGRAAGACHVSSWILGYLFPTRESAL